MPVDLSYIHDAPSEAQEQAVQKAIEKECLTAISLYLNQIADTMTAQNIETLNVPTIQAMAQEMQTRADSYGEDENN